MKTKLLFLTLFITAIISTLFIQTSCGPSKEESMKDSTATRSPEAIANQFLNYLNDNKPDEAKKLALPSAIEFVENLQKLDAFKEVNKWNDSIKIMDVVAKTSNEGDTAIVNYKIGDFKNLIKLVVKNKEWKIIYSKEINATKIIEISGFDLAKKIANSSTHDLSIKNYQDKRLRIKNLLYYISDRFIGYDPISNNAFRTSFTYEPNPTYKGKTLNQITLDGINDYQIVSYTDGGEISLKENSTFLTFYDQVNLEANFNYEFGRDITLYKVNNVKKVE